jgi:hypothetical protein
MQGLTAVPSLASPLVPVGVQLLPLESRITDFFDRFDPNRKPSHEVVVNLVAQGVPLLGLLVLLYRRYDVSLPADVADAAVVSAAEVVPHDAPWIQLCGDVLPSAAFRPSTWNTAPQQADFVAAQETKKQRFSFGGRDAVLDHATRSVTLYPAVVVSVESVVAAAVAGRPLQLHSGGAMPHVGAMSLDAHDGAPPPIDAGAWLVDEGLLGNAEGFVGGGGGSSLSTSIDERSLCSMCDQEVLLDALLS